MRLHAKIVTSFLVALAIALSAGCGGKEERKAKYLERGKAYFEEQNYDKARIEFKNVLQIDPKTAEPYYYLGRIAESDRDWRKAYGNYSKAVELNPALLEARAAIGRFELLRANAARVQNDAENAARALEASKEQLEEIRKRDPENVDGLLLAAGIAAHEGNDEEALAVARKALEAAPGRPDAAIMVATLLDKRGDLDQAIDVLEQAVQASDRPERIRAVLAQTYVKAERPDDAERVLKALVEDDPENFSYRVGLASFYANHDRYDDARAVLEAAIDADPEDAQRHIMLARLIAQKEGADAAKTALEAAIREQPDVADLRFTLAQLLRDQKDEAGARAVLKEIIARWGVEPPGLRARNLLATLHFQAGEFDEARRLVEEVLAENAQDNDALSTKAALLMRDKDYPGVIAALRSILKDQPDSVPTLMSLARAHLANGEPELAEDALRRAVESHPENKVARLALARFLFRQGKDAEGALEQVDALLKMDQANVDGLKLKAAILLSKGEQAQVAELVDRLSEADRSPETQLLVARFRLVQKDFDAALAGIDSVLAQDPDNFDALKLKADALVAKGDVGALQGVLDDLVAKAPEKAEGYFGRARVYRSQGRLDKAVAEYEQALENAGTAQKPRVLTELIETEVAAGRLDAAVERLQKMLAEEPAHPFANQLLGMVHVRQQKPDAAEKAFRRQIEIRPQSRDAYLQLGAVLRARGDLAGAEAVYREGLEALPDNLRLHLALAGVLEQQEKFDEAIALYRKILEKNPDNALATNNLAALLTDHGKGEQDLVEAKRLAERLANSRQPAFLDTLGWVQYRVGDYGRAVETLKGVVEKAPEVGIFRYHLGMALKAAGEKAAAREHLAKAVELGRFAEVEKARQALAELES